MVDPETLDKRLGKITHKLELICYFVKNMKRMLRITPDEFSGFICSGIMINLIEWIDNEFFSGEDNDEEKFTAEEWMDAMNKVKEEENIDMFG